MDFKIVFSLLTLITLFATNTRCDEFKLDYKELNSDEKSVLHQKFLEEKSESEREYLLTILRPEDSDINKDRKISRKEMEKVLINIVYPHDSEIRENMIQEIKDELNSKIELFVSNLRDFLTYGQFQYIMANIKKEMFFDKDKVANLVRAREEAREAINDL